MYKILNSDNIVHLNHKPIKAWIDGVGIEEEALQQAHNLSKMDIIHKWIALMPDVHTGKGSTIGSVIPTKAAIIPAAVGVDIGCGIIAMKTTLHQNKLPDDLKSVRDAIENTIPIGRTDNGGKNDRGAWQKIPQRCVSVWNHKLDKGFKRIIDKHKKLEKGNALNQLCSLGSGNHFCEVCLDEEGWVWVMLHSGSRGVGNRIGQYFINIAKEEMRIHHLSVPDRDLAYLSEGTQYFDDYVEAVNWAQEFARYNRELMMENVIRALRKTLPPFMCTDIKINCHHNYVQMEEHFGEQVYITRKGAVSAKEGEYGIIPGSMGARSYIVKGKGNEESFHSCSHGAGRKMSRTQAKKIFSLDDHIKATEGVECRKDNDVIDETPMAYKDIDQVMNAQIDLVEKVYTLKQIVCVKG